MNSPHPPPPVTRFPLLLLLTFLAAGLLHAQFQTDVWIRMSDGIDIDATIMKPLGFPPVAGFDGIVLIHGYGGSKGSMKEIGLGLALYGYASISYSVRGQGSSGGCSTVSGPREREDLREVVEFFRHFSQINPERIGIAGGSQGGIHSWMAAVDRLPGVMAVVPIMATPVFASDLVPNNCVTRGLPRELAIRTVRYCSDRDSVRALVIRDDYEGVMRYIRERDLVSLLDSVRIPVYQVLGWADFLFPVNGGIDAREHLAGNGVPVWSYFGTNGHGESIDTADALFVLEKLVKWFDHWIKGFSLPGDSVPMVDYADDRPGWPLHTTPVWPPEPHGTARLYFTESGLSPNPPAGEVVYPFSLTYDGAYFPDTAWEKLYGGPDFMAAFRSAPARLISDPLDMGVEITGVPSGTIVVRSDAAKFQAHIRSYDVWRADTGDVWQLMSRSINGFRDGVAGEWRSAAVSGRALSHIVPMGHRIGVELTSFDLLGPDQANTVPYFLTSHSELRSSPGAPSWIELPWVGRTLLTGVDEGPAPEAIGLMQNYPNPFNPATTIAFSLARRAHVELRIFDVVGREVAMLVSTNLGAGRHAARWDASGFGAGVYFSRLSADGDIQTIKLLLTK